MTNPKKNSLELKQQLYSLCQDFVENRRKTIEKTIKDLQNSLMSETKSSAGDKHETGRAMLQLEREKAGHQLAEIEKLTESLSKISVDLFTKTVVLGSIVNTSQANYYISISAGQIEVNGTKFFAISPITPIGILLTGKSVDDEVIFKNQSIKILSVL